TSVPESTVTSVFSIRTAREVLIHAFHEPAQIVEPVAPLFDDGFCDPPFFFTCVASTPTFDYLRFAEQACPPFNHFFSRQSLCPITIHVKHQVVMIRHDSVCTDVNRED